MTSRSALVMCLLLLSAAAADAPSASSWFLAEGASNALFTEEILVTNPDKMSLDGSIRDVLHVAQNYTPNPNDFVRPFTSW